MTSPLVLGFADGLGRGVADVGKMAYAAQIDEQRMNRLRQYQKEDHAQARAESQADYERNRKDTKADLTDQREFTIAQDDRVYQRQRADSQADYQRNRRDAVADRAHSEARADASAAASAAMASGKWGNLQEIKETVVDDTGAKSTVTTGYIGTKGNTLYKISLDGREVQALDGAFGAVGQDYGDAPSEPSQQAAATGAPAQPPAPVPAAPAPAAGGALSQADNLRRYFEVNRSNPPSLEALSQWAQQNPARPAGPHGEMPAEHQAQLPAFFADKKRYPANQQEMDDYLALRRGQ